MRSLNIWDGITASYDFDQDNALPRRSMRWRTKCSPARRPRRCSRVADYYETYPLDINVVLPDMFYAHSPRISLGRSRTR